jgi:hypothetical protein
MTDRAGVSNRDVDAGLGAEGVWLKRNSSPVRQENRCERGSLRLRVCPVAPVVRAGPATSNLDAPVAGPIFVRRPTNRRITEVTFGLGGSKANIEICEVRGAIVHGVRSPCLCGLGLPRPGARERHQRALSCQGSSLHRESAVGPSLVRPGVEVDPPSSSTVCRRHRGRSMAGRGRARSR